MLSEVDFSIWPLATTCSYVSKTAMPVTVFFRRAKGRTYDDAAVGNKF
jgi:hypothetical protein